MNIPFIGGAYLDRYGKINHQESQNLFPTVDSETGKVNAIIGTPGLELWAAPGTEEVRGLHTFGSYLYAVVGNTLYKIDTSGTATAMTGTIPYVQNSTTNLVSNGTLTSLTGWTAENATIACIAGGVTGTCLEATMVGGTGQGGFTSIVTEVGRRYRVSAYVKSGTAGNVTYQFFANPYGTGETGYIGGTSSGAWVQNTFDFVATSPLTSIYVAKLGTDAGTMLFDDVTAYKLDGSKVWPQNNGTDLMLVGGDKAYYLSGTTVTEATNLTALGTPATLAYQDGYFISSMKSSGQFFISGSYSATAWDALDYSTAEGDPDYLQVVISENRELWLLGKTSYEVWYNSGDSEFPFDRISGAVRKIGCIAPNSACGFMGTVVWLDDRRYVRASNGYNAEKVSTSQVDYHLASYSKVDDAVGYTYSQEGHTFYVLTFPTEDKTWVYDFSTKYWHTRASGDSDNRHPANCYAKFDDKHLIGDYSNGRIYYYDLGKYTDNGATLHRVRSARAIRDDRKRVYHSRFELDFDLG